MLVCELDEVDPPLRLGERWAVGTPLQRCVVGTRPWRLSWVAIAEAAHLCSHRWLIRLAPVALDLAVAGGLLASIEAAWALAQFRAVSSHKLLEWLLLAIVGSVEAVKVAVAVRVAD